MTARRPATDPMTWERPSERFLAYLERLAEACVSRDKEQMDKLLRMRLSSHLPRGVLDELEYFRRASSGNLRAPLKLMRHVHLMKQLASAPVVEKPQLTFELREREMTAPEAPTRRRTTRKVD